MASLTGTKIKDTYDSILKVSDNGALDGTLQTITDGLGNNSSLSLSTAGASVGGTLAVTGDISLVKNGTEEYAALSVENSNSTADLFVGVGGSAVANTSLRNNAYIINASASGLILGTNDTERMRITSEGYVGVGTGNTDVSSGDLIGVLAFNSKDSSTNSSGAIGSIRSYATSSFDTGNVSGDLRFYTQDTGTPNGSLLSGAERMRITSAGDVLIQTDSVGGAGGLTIRAGLNTTDYKIQLNGSGVSQAKVMELGTGQLAPGYGALRMSTANPGNGKYITFNAPDGSYNYADRGYIELSGTSILYTSVSDYRLKENVVSLTGALDRVDALKPCRFNFINDEDIIDGFLAHEVKEVVPHAVSGEKDAFTLQSVEVSPAVYEDVIHPAEEAVYETIEHFAIAEELDEEGNILVEAQDAWVEEVLVSEAKEEWVEKVLVSEAVFEDQEVPSYQGIDQSKIVPLLVAGLQEAHELIKSLQARIEALEA